MNARLAGERPSPMGCIFRRCLAKIVDVGLFALASYLAANLIQPDLLRFDAVVPAFLSVLWVLGFIISIDIAFVLVFGRTPGEMLTRIRVLTLEEERLSYSQRQDRTTDAFIDGTLGCISLLSRFWRREPAVYDKGCSVCFEQLSRQRLMLTALGLMMALALTGVASVVIGVKGIENFAPPALVQLLAQIGFDVQKRWVNPLTGRAVLLPVGWNVVQTLHSNSSGVWRINFASMETDDPWLVKLAVMPGQIVFTPPDEATSVQNLDLILGGALEVDYNPATLNPRDYVTGAARLDLLYPAQLASGETGPNKTGAAIAWFSNKENAWAVGVVHPLTGSPELKEQGYRLAFDLMRSTGVSQ